MQKICGMGASDSQPHSNRDPLYSLPPHTSLSARLLADITSLSQSMKSVQSGCACRHGPPSVHSFVHGLSGV